VIESSGVSPIPVEIRSGRVAIDQGFRDDPIPVTVHEQVRTVIENQSLGVHVESMPLGWKVPLPEPVSVHITGDVDIDQNQPIRVDVNSLPGVDVESMPFGPLSVEVLALPDVHVRTLPLGPIPVEVENWP